MRTQFLASASLVALFFWGPVAAQPQCSSQGAAGVWGYNGLGWSIPAGGTAPAPLTMIGVLVADHVGKAAGPGTVISGAPVPGTPIPAGQPQEWEFVNGSIEVNSDCVGVFKYSIQLKGLAGPPIGPYVDRVILFPDKGQMLGMSQLSPISKPMWIYTLTRMSAVPAPVSWPDVPAQAGPK